MDAESVDKEEEAAAAAAVVVVVVVVGVDVQLQSVMWLHGSQWDSAVEWLTVTDDCTRVAQSSTTTDWQQCDAVGNSHDAPIVTVWANYVAPALDDAERAYNLNLQSLLQNNNAESWS